MTDLAAAGARTAGVRPLFVVAIALAGCGGAPPGDESPVARDDRFVPPTHRESERVVMPLSFPDGTRATVAYPPQLALAELGVVPYGSATLQGDSPHPERGDAVGRDFLIRHGKLEPRPRSLVFEFGSWHVEVYDYPAGDPAAMTESERRSFRRSLSGRETSDGFLVLDDSPPLRLAEAGEHAGPMLQFGDPPRLLLILRRCGPKSESTSPRFASWCLSDDVAVHAYGGRRFAAAARALELTRPPAPRAPARGAGAGSRSRTPPPAARP